MKYEIIPIDQLIPLEKVFPTHLKNLEEMINRDGFVLKAIIADKKTGTIMDGSHRYVYFLKNGFKTVPVYWADYDDENIRIGTKLEHRFIIETSTGINKKECRERALSGNLFPPRTTRHFFTFKKSDISLDLDMLKRGNPVDVSWLIDDASVSDEIIHNTKYINEIDKELNIIIDYLSEISQTKKYLGYQISLMQQTMKVAFFPGKFHPPHIGHILTILNILPMYRKLIIGVTEDIPDIAVSSIDGIINTLNMFFSRFENVEITSIKGILTQQESINNLPEFDILLSGNEDVLSWAKKHGLNSQFIPRSEGFLCNGTEIRSLWGTS